ncbi:MAG: hypothetical protein IJX53_08325 [Clostridia bacterium]|nr:hypothetical protein [Clostridia bacterium]
MGIFGDVLNALKESGAKRAAKIEVYKQRFDRYDDEWLKRTATSNASSIEEKLAAAQLLKERGYYDN